MDLNPGDLVFCTKPSFMQSLLSSVGEDWRHVGMVVEGADGLIIGEVTGGHRIGSRTLSQILSAYEKVAIARVGNKSSSCLSSAADWVLEHVDMTQTYAWDDVLLIGISLLTKRGLTSNQLNTVSYAMNKIVDSAPSSDSPSMTCSAFVCESFAQAGDSCRISIPARFPLRSRSYVGSGPTLTYLLATNSNIQNDILNNFSLYELIESELAVSPDSPVEMVTRGHSKSSISRKQLQNVFIRVYNLIVEYDRHYPFSGNVELNTRWVTPGDIWNSSHISQREYLKGSEDEVRFLGTI